MLHAQRLLRLPVRRVVAAAGAELLELQAVRVVPLVLGGRVVPLLAVLARHPDDDPVFLRHRSYVLPPAGASPAPRTAKMEPPMGFEPMTPILPRWCATTAPGRP